MNFPRFWERKSDPTASLITLGLGQGPNTVYWPRDSAYKQATEGYMANATVFQCVNLISRAAAGVPWILTHKSGVSPKAPRKKLMSPLTAQKALASGFYRARKSVQASEVEDHPLLTLIERPNPHQGGAAYTEAVFAWLLISGNSYETFVAPETGPNSGVPRELWVQRADRMKVVTGKTGSGELIGGYQYWVGTAIGPPQTWFTDANSIGDPFSVENVLHQKKFHPIDDYVGLSPIQVAGDLIDAENSAHRWNRRLLDNDCRPSIALLIKSGLLPDARERLRGELETRFSGKENAKRPLVLEGDMDVKTVALSPSDMDFDAGLKQLRRIISHAFNVPAQFTGDTESQSYASAQEAHKELFQDNILPELDRRRDNLNAKLTVRFGDDLRLDYDADQIEALHEDTQRVYAFVATADYMSVDEQRQAVGMDDSGHPDGKTPRCFLEPKVVPKSPTDVPNNVPQDMPAPPIEPSSTATGAKALSASARLRHEQLLQRRWEKRFKTQRREILRAIDKRLGVA